MNLDSRTTLCILASALACGAAHADSNFNMPDGSHDISVAMTAFDTPRSEGGTRRQVGLLPSFTGRWANGIFASLGLVGWDVSDDPVLDYGPIVTYDLRQRRTDDTSNKIGVDVEGGAFAHYLFTSEINFNAALLYGGGAQRSGMRLMATTDFSVRLGPHAALTLSPGIELANASYMKSTFGVTQAQATADHFAAPYDTHAGAKNVFLNADIDWQVSNKWSLTGGINTSYLLGSAAHSPLTEKRTNATVYLSGGYHF